MRKHFKQQKKRFCQIKDKQVSYGVSGNCTKEQISKLDYISHYIVPPKSRFLNWIISRII